MDPENRKQYEARAEEWRKKCAEGQGDVLNAPDIAPKGAQTPKPPETTPFNIDEARREYSRWTQTLDEPYRSALRYYNDNTDYIQEARLTGSPFGYSPSKDAIVYSLNHPEFADYDFRQANTHELGHRLDALSEIPSWQDELFLIGLTQAQEYVKNNIDTITVYLANDRQRSDYLDDMLNALGVPEQYVLAGHEASYWTDTTRAAEVFANLFSMGAYRATDMNEVKRWFPDLYNSFLHRMEGV